MDTNTINISNNTYNTINQNSIAKTLYTSPIVIYPLYSIYYNFDKKQILKKIKSFKPHHRLDWNYDKALLHRYVLH